MSKDIERETAFLAQSEIYLEKCLEVYGFNSLEEVPKLRDQRPEPLSAVRIEDLDEPNDAERTALSNSFKSEAGVAYFVAESWEPDVSRPHVIHRFAEALTSDLPVKYPITHPLERHPGVLRVARAFDGTAKLYASQSRGVALSAGPVNAHVDGLGAVGTVDVVILLMERPSLSGGFTHFRNLARLALDLARDDDEAFRSLFVPDFVTVLRESGSRAIKVTGPVLFLGHDGRPKVFFRDPGGEYQVTYRDDSPAAARAVAFLREHAPAFARGSTFVSMSAPGHGCIIDNSIVAHGRTGFLDGKTVDRGRLLSRKWFASDPICQSFRHAPGIWISDEYARVFPEYFGPDSREGEWVYDEYRKRNTRLS